jgi:hypothetical protein
MVRSTPKSRRDDLTNDDGGSGPGNLILPIASRIATEKIFARERIPSDVGCALNFEQS